MSAKQRIMQVAEDLTNLETLASLISNLSAIKDAGKAARAEVTLTQEQEAKYNAALATIANAASVASQQQARDSEFSVAQASHQQKVDALSNEKHDFEQYLAAANAELDRQRKEIKSEYDKLALAKREAETANAVADAAMRRRESAAQKQEEANRRVKEGNDAEGARLAQMRGALDSKAKKLAEVIGA